MSEFTEAQLLILEKDKITCDDVEAFLGDLHDDEVPEPLKVRFIAHIDDCPHCKNAQSNYEMVITLAKEFRQPEELSLPVHNRLMEGLSARLGITFPSHPSTCKG